MLPKKINLKKYIDNRGTLIELTPKKISKKYVYSIITESKKNVIRGLHYDAQMKEEKLVYLIEGKIFDVTVNLNKGKNFKKKYYKNLKRGDALMIPRGYAHGYKCLGKKNILIYFLTKKYNSKDNKGIKWNDPALSIKWKTKKPIISKKDLSLPIFKR